MFAHAWKARRTLSGVGAAVALLTISACAEEVEGAGEDELQSAAAEQGPLCADAGTPDSSTPDSSTPDGGKPDAGPSGDLCKLKPYQVGILGDSYIHLSGDFTRLLQDNARAAGALGRTEAYIQYAMSGASLQRNNLLANAIPTQLPKLLNTSKQRGPEGVKLVIMTGGGNDVLIDKPSCKTVATATAECTEVVRKSGEVITKLLGDMATAGIKEVIYFWYPDLGVNGGKVINDYAAPRVKDICENHPAINCHFVDTRESFRGHPEYIKPDNIHPTTPGSKVIADLVWDVMVDNCIGSK